MARLLDCDPATIHLLLRDEAFVRLYRSYLALRQLPSEERLARLERLAVALLEEGEDPDAPPAKATPRPAADPVDRAARLRGSVVREKAATTEPPPEAEAAPRMPAHWLSADVLTLLAAGPEASATREARLLLSAKPQGP
ncbi:MAG TPA: hypothetical protein VFG43_08700 [Geminicoccaceae bacterium]|nr:hypothetical protein [Geminicoccaceae bacterium]